MSKKGPSKDDLLSWISPTSNNFLGSGMSMQEWMLARSIAEFQSSWTNQEPREKKRRFHFIVLLTQEMTRMQREHGTEHNGTWYVTAGAGMESCIKALIAGDIKDLKQSREMYEPKFFDWNYRQSAESKIWAERYAPFLQLCNDCIDTWPTGEEPILA